MSDLVTTNYILEELLAVVKNINNNLEKIIELQEKKEDAVIEEKPKPKRYKKKGDK